MKNYRKIRKKSKKFVKLQVSTICLNDRSNTDNQSIDKKSYTADHSSILWLRVRLLIFIC